ncbi:MAG: glucokinase [Deltaproteobacteria bacterium]|nr:glucokinase [Deltaproteobacteria bacterium]
MSLLLAADVGGTKTDLAVYDPGQGLSRPVTEATLASRDYRSFSLLLRAFLDKNRLGIERACFGVAGPVLNNRVKLTNLPWEIDGSDIGREFAINRVDIINDLVAVASSIPHLAADDLLPLGEGKPRQEGAIGVVAPGTGLGIAFCVRDDGAYHVCPSEGGHAGFSPGNAQEMALLGFLLDQGISPSFEALCSGSGLPNIYRFLIAGGGFTEPERLAIELARSADPTPVIVQWALHPGKACDVCRETLRIFVRILAEVCGNLAVTVLATGGIYLGGGMPAKILPFLREADFLARFRQKGKMSTLLGDIPVYVIKNPKAALIGAAAYGLKAHAHN